MAYHQFSSSNAAHQVQSPDVSQECRQFYRVVCAPLASWEEVIFAGSACEWCFIFRECCSHQVYCKYITTLTAFILLPVSFYVGILRIRVALGKGGCVRLCLDFFLKYSAQFQDFSCDWSPGAHVVRVQCYFQMASS